MTKSRRVILRLFLLGFAMSTAALHGQTPIAAPQRPADGKPQAAARPIDQLGWLVGGTWTTEEKNDDGGTLLVKLTCKWAETRQAILYKVSFESAGKDTPQYDGMYVWNPEKQKFTLWQVNRKGEVAEGTVTVNGDEMEQLVRVVHPDGGMHFLKAHYRRTNPDSFHFKAWFRLSETAEWQDALDIVYKRGA
jgi:hypothetical protein